MSQHYLSREEAAKVADAPPGMIEGIIKLAAHGLKAPAILEYATAIHEGKEPPALPVLGGPKPLTILLHSFLHDPRQYSDTYGLPSELISELRALELSDPEAARERVANAIIQSPRIIQSQRPVRVILDGSPGSAPQDAQPLANASGVTKSLSAEIVSNSALYGSYQFEAIETPLDLTKRFGVDLGQNFFVTTFSKKNAISIARIASVKGRADPSVVPYVCYVNSAGQALYGNDIPAGYWSCQRGPRDPVDPSARKLGVKPDKGKNAATTAVG